MTQPPNPYVGPRPLTDQEKLYGRDRELADLMDLLIAERIVLLYSPSGAGKSSLLQAGLMPAMAKRGFTVRNILRLNAGPPQGLEGNRYSVSAMASLKLEGKPEQFGGLSLTQYLDANPNGELLVFDQFEEVITADPFNIKAKVRFFDEIGEALRARGRWAVFAMREDYLARLDPYLRRIPTHLSNTFRLDLLSMDASIQAIRMNMWEDDKPVEVEFTLEAAQKLADNLSGLDSRVDLEPEALAGRFVEPVQLQVACSALWERLPEGTTKILPDHIEKVANIDEALGEYYAREARKTAEAVAGSMEKRKRTERGIRRWFGEELIRQGIRAQVLRGQGVPGEAVDLLEAAHLVRSESRLGSTWVELAHDRLIKPVQQNNAQWLDENLSELQKRAELWEHQKRDHSLLVAASQKLDRWEKEEPPVPGSLEEEFLKESRAAAQELLEAERRRLKDIRTARILKWGAVALAVLLVGALGAFAWALRSSKEATDALDAARKATTDIYLRDVAALYHNGQPAEALAHLAQALRTGYDSPRVRAWAAGFLLRGGLRFPARELDSGEPVSHIAFSGDGSRVVTLSPPKWTVWDAKTGGKIREGFGGPMGALSPDGKRLVVFADHRVTGVEPTQVIDLTTGEITNLSPLPEGVYQAEFSGDSKQLFTVSLDRVRLWGGKSGTVTFQPGLGEIQSAVFNAKRDSVLILGEHNAVLWKPFENTSSRVSQSELKGPITAAAISPDGAIAVVSSDVVFLWKFALAFPTAAGPTLAARSVGFTPDGQGLLLTGMNWAQQINLAKGVVCPMESCSFEFVWKVDTAGSSVAPVAEQPMFLEEATESLLLRDGGWQLIAQAPTRGRADAWALSPDGRTLAVASGERTPVEIRDVSPATSQVRASAEEARLISAQPVVPLKEVGLPFIPRDPDSTGILSDDGTRAAVISRTGEAQIFDVSNKRRISHPVSDWGNVQAMRFITGNTFLITGSEAGRASLWDVISGALIGEPVAHTAPIEKIALTPDGRKVVTSSRRDVLAWDLYLGSGSVEDGKALADLAEMLGGMRLAPGTSAPEPIPLAERRALYQSLANRKGLDQSVASAIARFKP